MSVFQPKFAAGRAVLLGAEIHCSLGDTLSRSLQALKQPPLPPQLVGNDDTEEVLQIPYKLLQGAPLDAGESRLFEVVTDVAGRAIAEAGLDSAQRRQMGLFVGSSSFDVSVSEALFKHELDISERALALRDPSFGRLANNLLTALDIRGPDFSINTACTASANALVSAITQIEAGLLEYALVLGVEMYNDLSALGFHSLGLLTDSVMKPFDRQRNGLVLGEGVSAVVVGRDPGDDRRRFWLRGSASLCDTHSISAAAPDGSTIREVMFRALQCAQLEPQSVAAIKVHGTASLSNDEAESAGMKQVFDVLPPVCALKPHIGHTLGACGLNELVLFCQALEAGFLVPTAGISTEPGELGIQLNQQPQPLQPGNFMLNYFGFGGNNCSLILSNLQEGEQ